MSPRHIPPRLLLLTIGIILIATFAAAQAQEAAPPKVDIFAGYSWLNPGGSVNGVKLTGAAKGFGVDTTYNFSKYVGLSFDGAGHWGGNADMGTLMVGPRFLYRGEQFQPFIHGMVGLNRLDPNPPFGLPADNGIGLKVGGGFDIPLKRYVSLRLFEADYIYSHHNFKPFTATTTNLNSAELRSGLVFNLGGGQLPPPLAATCSIQPNSVMAGEPVTLSVNATNIPKNHTVTYSYTSTGGKVAGKDNSASVDTNGLAPGSYTVNATVTDPKAKKGVPATCNANFTIQEPPKHPPTISCSANPTTVKSGEPATITATGNSPDNRPLTYTFNSTGGRLSPNGAQANLDTAGASAGPINITCNVSDDRGLTATSSTSVNVEVPPPPPQASKVNQIEFKNAKKPARVDNEAKAILDDYALRLQREADAKGVIVGNQAPDEKMPGSKKAVAAAGTLAQQRAVNTKAYLVDEKGIDPSRLEVRTGSAGNATSELWIVPQGATFSQPGTETFDESTVKPLKQWPGAKPAPVPHRAKKAPAAAPKS